MDGEDRSDRGFRNACLDGFVSPRRSLLLRSAIAAARLVTDSAANSKLSKRRSRTTTHEPVTMRLRRPFLRWLRVGEWPRPQPPNSDI